MASLALSLKNKVVILTIVSDLVNRLPAMIHPPLPMRSRIVVSFTYNDDVIVLGGGTVMCVF